MYRFDQFIGYMIKDVAMEIDAIAYNLGYSVSYTFPDGIGNIDVDTKRLNVHLDEEHYIIKFSIG